MSWVPTFVGVMAADIAAVPGLEEHTDNAFRYALLQMAERLLTNPDYIVAAMAVETAKTFSPSIQNPFSKATGLIQFMPSTAKNLGTSIEELAEMTQIAQLEYVEKYFKPFTGKMNNPNDAYLAVFYPAAMGKPADHVIASEGSKVYEQNKGFDKTNKGYITAGDVGAAAQNMLNLAAQKPRIPVTPEAPGEPEPGGEFEGVSSGFALLPALGLLGALGAGGYFLWQWYTGRPMALPKLPKLPSWLSFGG